MSLMKDFNYLKIQMEDIVSATNNFDPTKEIGRGGFGRVYKGELSSPEGQITVAFKQLVRGLGQGNIEFWKEIMTLSKYKHENVISLKHFCTEGDDMILVYEYASRGSLDQYLSDDSTLTWIQRLKICVGAACGLQFLHDPKETQQRVLHRDVKSANILLDENWTAKVSDFGLSKIGPANQAHTYMVSHGVGTPGYCDPLYMEFGFLSKESDVYSFGVVLFEILCGRLCYEYRNGELTKILVPEWRRCYDENRLDEIILPGLKKQMDLGSLKSYSAIAYQCVKRAREERPMMAEIVQELEFSLEQQEIFENTLESGHSDWDDSYNSGDGRLQLAIRRRASTKMIKKLEHLKIPLSNIKFATNNFSETYTIASWDEYTLYRAKLDYFDKQNPLSKEWKNKDEYPKGHNTVVIKRYPSGHDMFGEKEFFTEIEMLTGVKHCNIIKLLGFCVDGSEMILVIENFSNGYLADYLGNFNDMCILTWEKRLKMCIDVAHALKYIHSEMEGQKMIINRDISSYNIALGENWQAKIVGFEDSVFLPPNQEDEALYLNWTGRTFYIDPEYEKTNKLKRESDVYSFGVVLFEILCGRLASDPIYKKVSDKGLAPVARRSFYMGTLEDMIDLVIKEETNDVLNRGINKDSLHTFIQIAHRCLAETQDQRPTMKFVVKELEKALFFQEKQGQPVMVLFKTNQDLQVKRDEEETEQLL